MHFGALTGAQWLICVISVGLIVFDSHQWINTLDKYLNHMLFVLNHIHIFAQHVNVSGKRVIEKDYSNDMLHVELFGVISQLLPSST